MADSSRASGTTASRYEVLFELANGGMGRVSVARVRGTAGFQRLVALKTIHSFYAAEPRFQEMFFEEARLAAGIHHPNVVPVLDLGELEDTYFLTMEYVPGESLANVMIACHEANEQIPFGASLRWIADACAGLHAAHELRDAKDRPLGVVHRDVSPSNLIVTDHGTVKLIDFGIAKALSSRKETTTGALKGKVGYLSPEQVLAKKLDRRSDIFSLGVILYEVTTLRKLFGNPSHVETLQDIVRGEIPDPRDLVRGYPDVVADVVKKALERDRDKRFQTAEEMGAAVERAAHAIANPMVAADVTAWTRKRFGGLFDLRRKKIAVAIEAADRAEAVKTGRPVRETTIARRVPLANGDDQFQERTETAQIVAPIDDDENWVDAETRRSESLLEVDPMAFEIETVVQNKPTATITNLDAVRMPEQDAGPPTVSIHAPPKPATVTVTAAKPFPPPGHPSGPTPLPSTVDTEPGVPLGPGVMPVTQGMNEVSLASITVDRSQIIARWRSMPRWVPIAAAAGVVTLIGAVLFSRGGSTEHAATAPIIAPSATPPTVIPSAPAVPPAQPSVATPPQTPPAIPAPPAVVGPPSQPATQPGVEPVPEPDLEFPPAPTGRRHRSSSHRGTTSRTTSGTVSAPANNSRSQTRRRGNDFRPDDP